MKKDSFSLIEYQLSVVSSKYGHRVCRAFPGHFLKMRGVKTGPGVWSGKRLFPGCGEYIAIAGRRRRGADSRQVFRIKESHIFHR